MADSRQKLFVIEHLPGSGNMAKGKTDQIPVLVDLIPLDRLRDHQKRNKYVDMGCNAR